MEYPATQAHAQHQARPATALRAKKTYGFLTAALLCASLMALHGHASAQTGADGSAEARYKAEVAACNSGSSNQDRLTCLKEAGAARGEAKKDQLSDGRGALGRNAVDRCNALPPDDQPACLERIQGQGTSEGSVGGGGILRELVVPDNPK